MKYLSNPDMLLGLMRQMLSGMEVTLPLFFYTLIFSLPLGVIVAPMRMCKLKIVSVPTRVCILVLRGTPLILQIFAIYFILPRLLGHPFDRMASAVVAFVINYAAYFAEIFRGGLQSIPRGQREAGKALGFSRVQIFFRILDYRNRIPQTVCMIQKEVAERIAEKPGSKTYGILSVLLQAWYDIEYLFTVGSGAFAPPPKVQSAVIRLVRNSRTSLGCDEDAFKNIVKTSFGQRRKTLRNSLKPLIAAKASREGWDAEALSSFTAQPVFELRPERLSVEDFIALTNLLTR